jgi:hypothetical protein
LHARGKPLEIWWQDEARVGQQGTLTRVWAKRGSRPVIPRDRRFTWAYLFGAVCPDRGVGAAIVMPTVNIDAINEHLKEISYHVAPGSHCLLQVDGAGWHGPSETLIVPDNITLLKIPPYTPELNPVENIWEYLRGNYFSALVWEKTRPCTRSHPINRQKGMGQMGQCLGRLVSALWSSRGWPRRLKDAVHQTGSSSLRIGTTGSCVPYRTLS